MLKPDNNMPACNILVCLFRIMNECQGRMTGPAQQTSIAAAAAFTMDCCCFHHGRNLLWVTRRVCLLQGCSFFGTRTNPDHPGRGGGLRRPRPMCKMRRLHRLPRPTCCLRRLRRRLSTLIFAQCPLNATLLGRFLGDFRVQAGDLRKHFCVGDIGAVGMANIGDIGAVVVPRSRRKAGSSKRNSSIGGGTSSIGGAGQRQRDFKIERRDSSIGAVAKAVAAAFGGTAPPTLKLKWNTAIGVSQTQTSQLRKTLQAFCIQSACVVLVVVLLYAN
jgi:hypothetical protein